MIEDKLTHDERLRLECLAQAVAKNAMKNTSDEQIVETAARYEAFVKGERK